MVFSAVYHVLIKLIKFD